MNTSNYLHAIAVIENPFEYLSRYMLFDEFRRRMRREKDVVLHTVELVYPWQLSKTAADIKVWCNDSVMLHKENLINIALCKLLPARAKYVAWIDADVAFANPHWAVATMGALEKYSVVQMFEYQQDLGPSYQPFPPLRGYMAEREKKTEQTIPVTGTAWAYRREVLPGEGFCDAGILESGDRFILDALLGKKMDAQIYPQTYADRWNRWSVGLQNPITLGYVPGLLLHYWHGSRKQRQGRPKEMRPEYFKELDFDVNRDLRYNTNGVLEFTDPMSPIAQTAKGYFQQQASDSVEVANESEI